MAKRKKRSADGRSSKRRQKDERLLRDYSHLEYTLAQYRMAIEERVPVAMIGNVNGHRGALNAGYEALNEWFCALPKAEQEQLRIDIRWAITKRESLRSSPGMRVKESEIKAAAARIEKKPPKIIGGALLVVDDPL